MVPLTLECSPGFTVRPMTDHTTNPPIVCDMTDAPDTTQERLADYERLYTHHLVGRERTDAGIRFRLRADDGVEAFVRDLAAREKACCAFIDYDVARHGDDVHWDIRVVDDDIARQVLEELYQLPDTLGAGAEALFDRFPAPIVIRDGDTLRPASRQEIGLD
jgi:hypothetical protein